MAIQDPMSIMASASRLTITQLQQAIRNGTIPRDIGSIVLTQKIKEHQSSKQAQAMQQPAQPPVAQQSMAYQDPGIAAMPSNLPVYSAANGGIVAFADGDLVEEDGTRAYNRAAGESFLGKGLSAVGPAAEALAPYEPSIANLVKTAGGFLVDKVTGMRWVRNPYTGALVKAGDVVQTPNAGKLNQNTGKLINNEVASPKSGITSLLQADSPTGSLANIMPKGLTQSGAPATAPVDNGTPLIGGESGSYSSGSNSRSRGTSGGIKGYEVGKFDDSELRDMLASENNPATGKPYTYEEIAARNRERGTAAGVDYDIYKKQQAEVEGKKELSESRRKSNEAAPWFALSERLAQAKPGEHWASILGSGASAFGKTKAGITEKEEARLDDIRKEANQLALAQNAFTQAELSGNKADMAAAKAQMNAIRGKMSDMGVESTKAQNEAAKTMAELQNRRDIAEMQERGVNSRASADKNQINALANMYLKQANAAGTPITQAEAMEKAYYTAKFQGVGLGVEQREKAATTKAITEQLEGLKYAVTPEQKQRKAALEKQLYELQYGTAGAASGGYTPTAAQQAAINKYIN